MNMNFTTNDIGWLLFYIATGIMALLMYLPYRDSLKQK